MNKGRNSKEWCGSDMNDIPKKKKKKMHWLENGTPDAPVIKKKMLWMEGCMDECMDECMDDCVNAAMPDVECQGMHAMPECMLLAHAYVPWQTYCQAFCPREALMKGTLFPELWGVYPIPE